MVSKEEAEKYYKEYYDKKNMKRGRSINICDKLYRDFHKVAIDKGESMAKIVLMKSSIIFEEILLLKDGD